MTAESSVPVRRDELDAFEMIASLAKLINPEQTFAEVLHLATKWFDADGGQIIVIDTQTGKPTVKAISNSLSEPDLGFSSTILTDALNGNRPLCVPDAKLHPAYRHAGSVHDVQAPSLSVIVVPLHDARGHASGALYLQRRSRTKGLYDDTVDLERLSRLMDALSPIVFSQKQNKLFNSLRLKHTKRAMAGMGFIVGSSKIMDKEVYDRVEKYAQSDQTVCIQGETGTGKEWVSQAIHRLSPRASKPFVLVPCNAIPEGLAESELFGHVRGAFAQAYHGKPSPFERADGGTLFLNEIGNLPLAIQAKLLHVLEKGTSEHMQFIRVGGTKEIRVDVRVLAASNRDLRTMVQEGGFREDLFYRLDQLELTVPPLRERHEDIIPLAVGFLERISKGRPHLRLAEDSIQALLTYPWPGNVRELKSCIQRAVLLHEGEHPIEVDELLRGEEPSETRSRQDDVFPLDVSFRELSKAERLRAVRAAMHKHGDARKAAKELGVSRQTIYNYLADAAEDGPGR